MGSRGSFALLDNISSDFIGNRRCDRIDKMPPHDMICGLDMSEVSIHSWKYLWV